jgi:DNA-binding NarL/FixJ family response regulator
MFAGDGISASRGQGYLLKSTPEQMLDTIRQVHAGKKRVPPEIASHRRALADELLTSREVEVLRHITEGNQSRHRGTLFFFQETVKVHIKHIMGKLGATDRTQAMAIAARRGFISV